MAQDDKNEDTAFINEDGFGDFEPMPLCVPTPEERAAVLLLAYDDAVAALEGENPAAVAVATEFILKYSEEAGKLLKGGGDYLSLLTPGPATPAMEGIAMEIVLETLEEELESD